MLRLISDNTNKVYKVKVSYFIYFSYFIYSFNHCSFFIGLNLGIDFKGGILLELRSKNVNSPDINDLRNRISSLDVGEISIQNLEKILII